jgi:leucyl aminopeptidase
MIISVLKNSLSSRGMVRIAFNQKIAESRFVVTEKKEEILEIKPQVKDKISRRQLVILARQIISLAKKNKISKIVLNFKDILDFKSDLSEYEIGEILAINFEMANYEFVKYKTKPKDGWNFIEEVRIIFSENQTKLSDAIKTGQLIGREVNASRDLANTPGGEMTPTLLAQEIKKSIKNTKIKMKVLEVADMKKLGMGGILGVANGSSEKPKFIILEYVGKEEKNPLVLVGKAITFDTGGISLKPADSMVDMHMDMSGGSAVAYAMIAAAKLKTKKKIIGLIPAAENMPSGQSYRPGDILKTMSGKTIEVLNTDAEGRIILADALIYAEKYNPKLVVDVATLTGASMVALGERASAILSKNEKTIQETCKLGEESGDYVWPFPLWDEYENEIEGTMGDVANLKNKGNSRAGGVISGAMFLYQFAKKHKNWMHIDMGSRDKAVYDEFLSKGSAGAPVRLLIKIIEKF